MRIKQNIMIMGYFSYSKYTLSFFTEPISLFECPNKLQFSYPWTDTHVALSGFLSSIGSNFIICGNINVHLDVECGDRSRFNDNLQCCSLRQSVSGPTHILGHTLDVLISLCDSDFVHNINVGDFISDHAAIRCQLNFSHPTSCIEKMVSYCRYHRIDIDQFCNGLSNIPFVLCPGGTSAELYHQYMVGVTQVLDKHAPIILCMTKRQSDQWLSDSYHLAPSLRRQFVQMWRKHKDTVEQVKAPQANCLVQSTGQ